MAKLTCSKCGEIKTGSYIKESQCGKCINERRKARRKRLREAKGLPPYGSGRDPKCKICRADKEERYMNGSYCAKCKLEFAKIAYAEKIKKEGKEPRRKGRNPICKCGAVKESPKESHCRSCNNEKKRQLRLKKKMNDPDFLIKEREKINKWYEEDELHALKRRTREATTRRIKAGILIKGNCEVCGTNKNIQAHHDDYNDPMNIRWLCSLHHAEHHKKEKL